MGLLMGKTLSQAEFPVLFVSIYAYCINCYEIVDFLFDVLTFLSDGGII